MEETGSEIIDVSCLEVGMYVYLDLGWLSHPFPLNNFRIRSQEQIDVIRSLGLRTVRYVPQRSDPAPDGQRASGAAGDPVAGLAELAASAGDALGAVGGTAASPDDGVRQQRLAMLTRQCASLKRCEREYAAASRAYKQVIDNARTQPAAACAQVEGMVCGVVEQLVGDEENSIRLLSEQAGERTALHAINVTIISLLLGRACGLDAGELHDVGVGALLHDIGKIELPDRLRYRDERFSFVEVRAFQEHVAHGVQIARRMGLGPGVLSAIAQHHEFADGSGYPQRLCGEAMTRAARIVSLVNHYDSLCNPGNPANALTPHEALSQIFAVLKKRFDAGILGTFIRMMGVYPPGSVVQLTDERHALVVSVNSSRPLKPRVVIHEPSVPKDEALIVDLEQASDLGIRRSLKPAQLPKAAMDYLSPRTRICYFFERARDLEQGDEA